MTKLAFLIPALALALVACGEEPAPAPVETPVAAPTPTTPSLPAPDQAKFTEVFAAACPEAEPVSTALCRSQGLQGNGFVCDYGLGTDEYRRNTAVLVPADGEWTLDNPETVCAPGAE